MAKLRAALVCGDCRQKVARWVGRCPGCGAWGTIEEGVSESRSGTALATSPLIDDAVRGIEHRVSTGFPDVDRVLGGGLVPASLVLLAGEPGIGKSTLLLHLVAHLGAQGHACLLVSGEESHAQVAARARRLGIPGDAVRFASGRDLDLVLQTARAERPFLLAVDSIQTIRDADGTHMPGGVSQVRTCTDALAGLAKSEGVAVLATGHLTKDGDLAGPRALEHAVDVVLTFDGDPRSGSRVLVGGKNRFGAEGESAWFEMSATGLREIDPTPLLVSGEPVPGAAIALARSGRRAIAVEVQALVGSPEGQARRQATGLDPRRFQLVAAVLDRIAGLSLARAELFGASCGGVRIDDPACDLAVAAALASAATGSAPPARSAFVGEVSLTGLVRPAQSMTQRLAAARAGGVEIVFAPAASFDAQGVRLVPVRDVKDALPWMMTTS
ncbi:MAG: AAA family ATPase [Actinomycetota bacterium]|nr:AAA family ATPase [Actinomycetota bacterium]MDH5223177.1 AAA family ATPase [Actinomycetota bacterium]MDH5312229.1 AAA family ATPase [Actinomycetota bacterium]